jgi:ABC-type sugar transport system ATPase subunit
MLAEFFHIMEAEPVFNGNTMVQTLSIEQKQLFEVFRAVKIEHCKILVIVDGFDNIDIVSRRKLTKYLLKQTSINMLIETTNLA